MSRSCSPQQYFPRVDQRPRLMIGSKRRHSVGNAMALEDISVSEKTRMTQSEEDTNKHIAVITQALNATTGGKVHIEITCVERGLGYTDFPLSPDSCSGTNAAAINSYFMDSRYRNTYRTFTSEIKVKNEVTPINWPVSHRRVMTTVVVRAKAMLEIHTPWKIWSRIGTNVVKWFLLLCCIFVMFFIGTF